MRWILADGNWLAHALRYGLWQSGCNLDENPEQVLFGYLETLRRICLAGRVRNNNLHVFVDSKRSLRRELVESYKSARRSKTVEPNEAEFNTKFWAQMLQVWNVELPRLGVSVYVEDGFEADDLIAKVCKDLPRKDFATIVSADNDLFQCLSKQVDCYNSQTGKHMTLARFEEEKGISVSQWVKVKAIAGCPGDSVSGVRGVGEITAIKWLRQELPTKSVYIARIAKAADSIKQTMRLVQLPFEGTSDVTMTETKWNQGAFRKMCVKYNFQEYMAAGMVQWAWAMLFRMTDLRDRQSVRKRRYVHI